MALAGHNEADSVRLATFANLFNVRRVDEFTVRSEGRHAGGGFEQGRLFGGHTAAQIHLAFRCLKPHLPIHTLRVNFVAPGNVDDFIDFTFSEVTGTDFVVANITQKGRTIASAKIRFGLSTELLDQSAYFMPCVGPPLSYSGLYESLRKLKNENVATAFENVINRALFDIRAIDFEHVALKKHSWEPVRFWCSLNAIYKDSLAVRDGISVVLLLSDYMIIRPVRIHYKQLGRSSEFGGAASLNHTVWFHTIDGIDPDGWFLYESSCNRIANTRSLIEARIFDANGRCVLSSVQEAYINSKL